MNVNDLRYTKTDNAIKQSFFDCVSKYGFDKTTITMICETASIGRKTFYLHYQDKFDLLDKLFEDFKVSLRKSFGNVLVDNIKANNVLFSTELYINAIYDNREIFLFLANCSKEKTEDSIFDVVLKESFKEIVPDYEKFLKDEKNQLRLHYMFSAMVSFTEYWLKHMDTITKEEAATELFKLCERPTLLLHEYFKK